MCNLQSRLILLELAVYHLTQMSVNSSDLCCFVIEYLLSCFHQKTPLDLAAELRHEKVVAYLKSAADPNMLGVCETVSLKIAVVSSGESLRLNHSCHLFHMWEFYT